jgi:hypothetical protein
MAKIVAEKEGFRKGGMKNSLPGHPIGSVNKKIPSGGFAWTP